VIDLHLHTTASDGRCTPEELIERAHGVGLETVAVTDHDTMAGVPAAAAAAARHGLQFVPGIEITSVSRGRDAHVLAYFLDPEASGLSELIREQRERRVARAREIAVALDRLGAPIDVEALVASAGARSGKALARPQIAQALIAAGHVETIAEAFERFLGESCPAYVPHTGASPADVVALVVKSGGIASLAHPGQLKQDEIVGELVDAGLAAIEVYHSAHDAETTAHYLAVARRFGLSITGGSDYHGEGVRRAEFFGVTNLPAPHFAAFLERAGRSKAPSGSARRSAAREGGGPGRSPGLA
jgi:predicted metal-dependent phosphoesterase TrpH